MVLSPVVGIMSNNLLSFNSASQVLPPSLQSWLLSCIVTHTDIT